MTTAIVFWRSLDMDSIDKPTALYFGTIAVDVVMWISISESIRFIFT